jgi:hypothetical protein
MASLTKKNIGKNNRVGKCTKQKLLHKTNGSLLRGSVNPFLKIHPFWKTYVIKTNFLDLTSTGYNRHEEKCTKLTVTPTLIFVCISINIPDL